MLIGFGTSPIAIADPEFGHMPSGLSSLPEVLMVGIGIFDGAMARPGVRTLFAAGAEPDSWFSDFFIGGRVSGGNRLCQIGNFKWQNGR